MGRTKSKPKRRHLDLSSTLKSSASESFITSSPHSSVNNSSSSSNNSSNVNVNNSIETSTIYIRPSFCNNSSHSHSHLADATKEVAEVEEGDGDGTSPFDIRRTTRISSVIKTTATTDTDIRAARKPRKRRRLEQRNRKDGSGVKDDAEDDSCLFQMVINNSEDDNNADVVDDDVDDDVDDVDSINNINKRNKLNNSNSNMNAQVGNKRNSFLKEDDDDDYDDDNDEEQNEETEFNFLHDKIEIIPCRRKDCKFIIQYYTRETSNNDDDDQKKEADTIRTTDHQRLIQSVSIRDAVLVYHKHTPQTTYTASPTTASTINNNTNHNNDNKPAKRNKKLAYNYIMKPKRIQNTHDNIHTIKEWIYKLQKRSLKKHQQERQLQQQQEEEESEIHASSTTSSCTAAAAAAAAAASSPIRSSSEPPPESFINLDSIELAMHHELLDIIIQPQVHHCTMDHENKNEYATTNKNTSNTSKSYATTTNTTTDFYSIEIQFYLTQYALSICSPQSLGQNILTQSTMRRCKKDMRQRYDHALLVQSILLDMFPSSSSMLVDFGVLGHKEVQRQNDKNGGKRKRGSVLSSSSSSSSPTTNRISKNGYNYDIKTIVTAKMVYDAIDNIHLNKEIEKKRQMNQTGNNAMTDGQDDDGINTHDSSNKINNNCNCSADQSITFPSKIKGLVPTLREYQRLAVQWMVQRESGKYHDKGWEICWLVFVKIKQQRQWQWGRRPNCNRLDHSSSDSTYTTCTETRNMNEGMRVTPFNDGLEILSQYKVMSLFQWKESLKRECDTSINNSVLYYNPITGWVVKTYDDARRYTLNVETNDDAIIRGGILAESMGLGKTVELLACILSNPCTDEFLRKSQDEKTKNHDRNRDSTALQVNTTHTHGADETLLCYCGRDETSHSLPWVKCSKCGQMMHGVCAGFTSRADLIAKTTRSSCPRICDNTHCPFCQFKFGQDEKTGSRATLIVTPPSILNQWKREIRRHTSSKESSDPNAIGQPLKVLVYPGVREICSTTHLKATQNHCMKMLLPQYLADADVVLTTFDTLRVELGHSNENPFLSSRRTRKEKKYKVVPTPLVSIKWWRICLDEAQKIETSTAASAKMALNLVAQNKWCVSGTPIGRGKIDDLYGLYLFLNAKPFCYRHCLENYLKPNMRDIRQRIRHCIFDVMWRSTKTNEDVKRQMGIPSQTENKVVLQFSSIERHFYQRQLEYTINAANFVMDNEKRRGHKKEANELSTHLHRLRAACCHPQVGSSGISKITKKKSISNNGLAVTKGVLTMSQILDRLIDDAKVKAEESQRVFTMHTNALASLKRLESESLDRENHDIQLIRQCCDHYFEALEGADKNSIPSPVVGEAILSGSDGFQFSNRVMRDGEGKLLWRIRTEQGNCSLSLPALWARFDFTVSTKKINSLMVRASVKKDMEEVCDGAKVLLPKDCVLQVSSAAMNGMFVDAIAFTISCPKQNDDIEWQEFFGVIPNRSKSWRICVKNFHNNVDNVGAESGSSIEPMHCYVGLEIQLMEPDIAHDNLQRIHILHNVSTSLRSLLMYDNNQDDSLDEKYSKSNIQSKIKYLSEESSRLELHYIEAARVIQQASDNRLKDSTSTRKQLLAELNALDSGSNQPWPIELLTWCHLYGGRWCEQSICDHVERGLFELYDDPTQNFRRRTFPAFNNLDGLNFALSLKLERGCKVFRELDVPECISKVEKLSDRPLAQEVLENSHCRKCRADWDQRGPVCQSCKLEAELIKYQEQMTEVELNCILRGLAEWFRDNLDKLKPRKSVNVDLIKSNLKSIHEKIGKFFSFKDAAQKELECARVKWRTHFNLLSDIDELNQCKRAMRLAYENENLFGLTEHELAFIVQPCDIPSLILDHATKQAMSEAELRRSKQKLRFLKNQNLSQKQGASDETCTICLNRFGDDRAVLRCGHVFHYSPCIERLLKRGNVISCPMRCAIQTAKDQILIASEKSKDDGSKTLRSIEGSWGTKVDRLISDLLEVVEKGEKSLVFSQWDDMLSIMEHALEANKIEYIRPKSMKRIGDVMDIFRTNHCHVLLMHVKHGAEGLTLVEANHVFMVEPLLNHSVDSQAINRIHRIGQTQKTFIHRYLIADTVEMKIDKIRMERQENPDSYSAGSNQHKPQHDESICNAGGFDDGCSQNELKKLLFPS